MMEIHVIFGPTATSKTKIAQGLWKQYHYPILSVDSRKVYRGADIGTNKTGILEFIKAEPMVLFGGIDFLDPNEEVSVYKYQQYVYDWIDQHQVEIEDVGGLIIHGGTGLYLDAILEGSSLLSSRDEALRKELENKTVEELQNLVPVDSLEKMNESDKKNPRRLVRAIENSQDAQSETKNDPRAKFFQKSNKIWHIDIPSRELLYQTINDRVMHYFSIGWMEEVATLLAKFGPDAPALRMMGYRQLVTFMQIYSNWQQMFDDDMPEFQAIVAEIQREHRRYAKRQETWAKKYPFRELET